VTAKDTEATPQKDGATVAVGAGPDVATLTRSALEIPEFGRGNAALITGVNVSAGRRKPTRPPVAACDLRNSTEHYQGRVCI